MNNGKDSSINKRLECQRHILLWLQGIMSQDTVKTQVAQDYFLSRTYASQFRTPGADVETKIKDAARRPHPGGSAWAAKTAASIMAGVIDRKPLAEEAPTEEIRTEAAPIEVEQKPVGARAPAPEAPKEETPHCLDCGKPLPAGSKARYCPECRQVRLQEAKRRYKEAHKAGRGIKKAAAPKPVETEPAEQAEPETVPAAISQNEPETAPAVSTVPAEDDYTCFCMNQIERIKATFARKRKQYATGADPLANFFFDTDGSFAAAYENGKGYVKKHIANVLQHDITGNVADSWGDIAVYAIIMLYMIHKHQEEEGEDVQS